MKDRALLDGCLIGIGSRVGGAFVDGVVFKALVGTPGVQTPAVGGIGVNLRVDRGYPIVVSPIENSPAHLAGIKSGDAIIRIDSKSTYGLRLDHGARLLRGDVGSTVTVYLERLNVSEPISVSLTRRPIYVQSVRSKVTPQGFAYVRVSGFLRQTPATLLKHLQGILATSPALTTLVLDLRNNEGGLLESCIDVASIFLEPETRILEIRGRAGTAPDVRVAKSTSYLGKEFPRAADETVSRARKLSLVVLVNRSTASGAEAIAAAFQDHKRALVVGIPTQGVANIQRVFPLGDDTGLRITTGRMFRASGAPIDLVGVEPDRQLAFSEREGARATFDFDLPDEELDKVIAAAMHH